MSAQDIVVPDLGDFSDVEIIEVLVAPGDSVEAEQSLITLETDKASMEVPAASAGTIASLSVKVGDTVSSGDVIGTLEAAGSDAAPAQSGDGAADAAGGGDTGDSSDQPATAAGGGTLDVNVPDIGDAKGVEVIEVLVAVGDSVTAEQSLVTLESDKASMEVPSPAAGTVSSIAVSVGDTVDEGSPVLVLKTEGGAAAPSADAPAQPAEKPADTPAQKASEKAAAPTPASEPAARPAANAGKSGRPSPTAHLDDAAMRRAHASPGVRRYAREHGADLSQISGSGPKGRILKEDVRQFIKQSMENQGSSYGQAALEGHGTLSGGGAGIPPIPEVDFSKFGEVERVEMGRINKLSAANLHRAWLNVPMVTHHDEADITSVEQFRGDLKKTAKEGDPRVTGLAFHMKALAATLKAHPKVNSSLSSDGQALFYKRYVHIGIAVDTPNGLVVPVFRDVDKKSIYQLAIEMADMSKRARDKKLKPGEMQGASMTISSLGGIGGTAFTPIVNPPEVAILGITRAQMKPVWNGKEFEPRLMCPLDMSYDHRVVDGADAARFMADYVTTIGDIRRLLL